MCLRVTLELVAFFISNLIDLMETETILLKLAATEL